MTAVVIGGLRMRKLRAVLTAISIVLGVAMISGTYVLMDTTMHAFNSVFATAYSKADAVVVGKSAIAGPSRERAPGAGCGGRPDTRAAAGKDVQGFVRTPGRSCATRTAVRSAGRQWSVGVPGRAQRVLRHSGRRRAASDRAGRDRGR